MSGNMDRYILNDKREAVPCQDTNVWRDVFSDPDRRRVGRAEVGAYEVSTVFLAIDRRFGDGPPVLFETSVSDPDGHEVWMKRYSTWAEAEAGHQVAVAGLERGDLLEDDDPE